MTSDELRANGYVEIAGVWYAPGHQRARLSVRNNHPRPVVQLERNPRNGDLAALRVQEKAGQRFLIRVASHRKRLLDEDNLCAKFAIDLCRYAGILLSDSPGTTKIEISQEKVGKGESEFVRIQVFRI